MATLREEDIIFRENIKLRLIELRKIYGKTKADTSEAVEVDRQNFQEWEKPNSNRGMTIYSINRICLSFGITLKDFFDSPLFK